MAKYFFVLLSVLCACRSGHHYGKVVDMSNAVSVRCAIGERIDHGSTDTIWGVAEHMLIGDTVLVHHCDWSYPTPREYRLIKVFYMQYQPSTTTVTCEPN